MVIDKKTLNNIATGLGIAGFFTNTLASSGIINPTWANLINAVVTLGLGYVTQKPTTPVSSVPAAPSIPISNTNQPSPVVASILIND